MNNLSAMNSQANRLFHYKSRERKNLEYEEKWQKQKKLIKVI